MGEFDIMGIKGTFPTQAITSTNLNHFKKSAYTVNFKTNIVMFIEFEPNKLLTDPEYRERQKKQFCNKISKNPGYLYLFTLNNLKSTDTEKRTNFTRDNNEILINFQKDCGFSLITAFFNTSNIDLIKDSQYYRTLIPEHQFIACLDEHLYFDLFKALYLECLEQGDKAISFFGRTPNKKNTNSSLKLSLLRGRSQDKILRLASCIEKSTNGVANSLTLHWYGYDAYSFRTILPSSTMPKKWEQQVLEEFRFKSLSSMPSAVCVITKKKLQESVRDFTSDPSAPVATYNIVKLNENFKRFKKKYDVKKIRKILGDLI